MHEEHKYHIPPEHNRFAPECDDQLPVFSTVGRGPKGDSYRVKLVDPDTHQVTQLVGETYDEVTKTWHTEWMSENINGGYLEYQYHLRPYNVPATFTITFKYHRPSAHGAFYDESGRKVRDTQRKHDGSNKYCGDGKPNDAQGEINSGDDPTNECSWVWTTPAIPYIWTTQGTDEIVGSGCATIFARECHDVTGKKIEGWPYRTIGNRREYEHERLEYPTGWTREQFNAPRPYDPWTSQMIFGYHGNIQIPDFDDIALIVGAPIQNIINIIEGEKDQLVAGMESGDNIIDLIKNWMDHIHRDLGYDDGELQVHTPGATVPDSNNPATIKNYIKAATTEVQASDEAWLTVEDVGPGENGQHIYEIDDKKIRDEINDLKRRVSALEGKVDELGSAMEQQEGDVTYVKNLVEKIFEHIVGDNSINKETGDITWQYDNEMILTGDINIYTGESKPYGIVRGHEGWDGLEHDLWAI